MSVVVLVGYLAFEAGSAEAMQPVWETSRHDRLVGMTMVAARHIACVPDFALDTEDEVDHVPLEYLDLMVLSATGAPAEGRLLARAAARSLPVVQLIDTWGPYAPRFRAGMATTVATVDERSIEEAVAENLPRGRFVAVGNPAWERVQPLPAVMPGVVAFLSQPIRRFYGTTLGYDEVDAFDLVCRLHRARPDLIESLIVVRHPAGDALSIGADEQATLAEALARADTVIGMFSSAMVNAAINGRRVISLQPGSPDRDMCGLSRHGRISRAGSEGELAKLLVERCNAGARLAAEMAGSLTRFAALIEAKLRSPARVAGPYSSASHNG